jgi:NAD(P)-dependent dehydrogenase (short-subunit alcohol dehydrogenase family)
MPKTAIVTGASRGIGLAIAHALAQADCDLLLQTLPPPWRGNGGRTKGL